MLADIKEKLKLIDPDLNLTINFAALYSRRIRDMLDYQFTEPWAGNWLSAGYSRDTAGTIPPQLGPGDVSEVYNYKPLSIYRLAAGQLAAAGCRVFMYSGSQHVDGTLEHEESRRIGAAFADVMAIEPWLTDRALIADIAIIHSESSSLAMSGNRVIANAIGRCKRSDMHREAVLGAMRCCDAACLTYMILPEQDATIDTLRSFQLVILAGVSFVDDNLSSALTEYANLGGAVLMDGISGLYDAQGTLREKWPLSGLAGGALKGMPDQFSQAAWGAYIEPDEHSVWHDTPKTLIPVGPVQFAVEAQSATPVGRLRMPAVALTEETWVNWWCPPPAAEATDYPALLENKHGKGKVIYLAYEFFRDRCSDFQLSQAVFEGLMQRLLPSPAITLASKTPETLGIVAYRRGDQRIRFRFWRIAHTSADSYPVHPAD